MSGTIDLIWKRDELPEGRIMYTATGDGFNVRVFSRPGYVTRFSVFTASAEILNCEASSIDDAKRNGIAVAHVLLNDLVAA